MYFSRKKSQIITFYSFFFYPNPLSNSIYSHPVCRLSGNLDLWVGLK